MFQVFTWPPNSVDLSQIEHLLDVLDKQVQSGLKGYVADILVPDTKAHLWDQHNIWADGHNVMADRRTAQCVWITQYLPVYDADVHPVSHDRKIEKSLYFVINKHKLWP